MRYLAFVLLALSASALAETTQTGITPRNYFDTGVTPFPLNNPPPSVYRDAGIPQGLTHHPQTPAVPVLQDRFLGQHGPDALHLAPATGPGQSYLHQPGLGSPGAGKR